MKEDEKKFLIILYYVGHGSTSSKGEIGFEWNLPKGKPNVLNFKTNTFQFSNVFFLGFVNACRTG